MRIVGTAILVTLGALLVALSVVNRQHVTLRLDPFGFAPEASLTAPLYAVILAAAAVGVVVGGIAARRARVPPRLRRARRRGSRGSPAAGPSVAVEPAARPRRAPFLTSR